MKAITLTIIGLLYSIFLSAQSPDWMWAKSLNGKNYNSSSCIVINTDGDMITAGQFRDTVDFDPDSINTYNMISSGEYDAYLCKYDADGTLLWARSFGGPLSENINALALSALPDGSFYLAGKFETTTDLDPGPGVFTATANGLYDFFIARYDSSGGLIWATAFGGTSHDYVYDLSVDPSGNFVYACGNFSGTVDFDPGPGSFTLSGSGQGYVLKLNNDGTFAWAKKLVSMSTNNCADLAADPSGSGIYIVGNYTGSLFSLPAAAHTNGYVMCYDSIGTMLWIKAFDGSLNTYCYDVIADAGSNSLYIAGSLSGSTDFDPGLPYVPLVSTGDYDAFIVKMSYTGNLIWARSFGGLLYDAADEVALNQGQLMAVGTFEDTADFNPGISVHNLYSDGLTGYILSLDTTGNFSWAKAIGNTCTSVAVDAYSNNYITGVYFDSPYQLGPFTLYNSDTTALPTSETYIAKIGNCSAYFSIFPDTIPHNWLAVNYAYGTPPLNYTWDWGDGSSSIGPFPSHTYSSLGYYNICLTIADGNGCSSTYCDSSVYLFRGNSGMITISVISATTGITESKKTDEVIIYPNPANDKVNIISGNFITSVKLVSLAGKELLTQKNTYSKEIILNTRELNPGAYLLHIESGSGIIEKKLMIIR